MHCERYSSRAVGIANGKHQRARRAMVAWLAGYGNVSAERTAHLIGMLLGMPVSAGFVDKAARRLDVRLQDAGFDDAMRVALAAEPAPGADETRSACSP